MIDEGAEDLALSVMICLRNLHLAEMHSKAPVGKHKTQTVVLVLLHWEPPATARKQLFFNTYSY